jgi:hypothetical protein
MNRFNQARMDILVNKPLPKTNITFQTMYSELSQNWEEKAQQLQQRRWRYIQFS